MSGRRSRNSGRRFEQEVARELRRLTGAPTRRALQSHKAYESDVTGVPGLWVECQFAQRVTPLGKCRQAVRDARAAGGGLAVVVFRQKGQPRSLPRFRVAVPRMDKANEVVVGWTEHPGGLEPFIGMIGPYLRRCRAEG